MKHTGVLVGGLANAVLAVLNFRFYIEIHTGRNLFSAVLSWAIGWFSLGLFASQFPKSKAERELAEARKERT